MLGTHPVDDVVLRCETLLDRIAATPLGPDAETLRRALADCDAMERALADPAVICRLRDVRHWLRLTYGHTLHGYPADRLRESLIRALTSLSTASRAQGGGAGPCP